MFLRSPRDEFKKATNFLTDYREYKVQGSPKQSLQALKEKFNALGEVGRGSLAKELGLDEGSLKGVEFERFEELEKGREERMKQGQEQGKGQSIVEPVVEPPVEQEEEEEQGPGLTTATTTTTTAAATATTAAEQAQEQGGVVQATTAAEQGQSMAVEPVVEAAVEKEQEQEQDFDVGELLNQHEEILEKAENELQSAEDEELAKLTQAVEQRDIKVINESLQKVNANTIKDLFQEQFANLMNGADNLAVVQALYKGMEKEKDIGDSIAVDGIKVLIDGIGEWNAEKVKGKREEFNKAKQEKEIADASVTQQQEEQESKKQNPLVAENLVENNTDDLKRQVEKQKQPATSDALDRSGPSISDLLTEKKLEGNESAKKKAIMDRMLSALGATSEKDKKALSENALLKAKVDRLYTNNSGKSLEDMVKGLEEGINNERKNIIMQAYMNRGTIRPRDVRGSDSESILKRYGKDAEQAEITAEEVIDALEFQRKQDLGFLDAPGEYMKHNFPRLITAPFAWVIRAPGNFIDYASENQTQVSKWISGMSAAVFLLIPGLAPFAFAAFAVFALINIGEFLANNEAAKWLGKIAMTLITAPLEIVLSTIMALPALIQSRITGKSFTEVFDSYGYKPFVATKSVWVPDEKPKQPESKPFENPYQKA